MEEKRIDCRIMPSEEQMATDMKLSKLVYDFNHGYPMDPEVMNLPKEIFKGKFGEGSRVAPPLLGVRFNNVTIGKNVIIGQNTLMMSAGGITIDDKAMLAANCQLLSNNHDPYERMVITCKPIHICEGAWLGAASGVTHDVPDYAVAVGNPARVIKYLDPSIPQK